MPTHRQRVSSGLGQGAAWLKAQTGVEIPDNVKLPTKAHKELFVQFTAYREPANWFEADLVRLAEYIQITLDQRKCERLLRSEGEIVYDDKGNMKPNPRVAIISTYHRNRAQIIRALGLDQVASSVENGGKAKRARAIQEANAKQEQLGKKPLLAQPGATH